MKKITVTLLLLLTLVLRSAPVSREKAIQAAENYFRHHAKSSIRNRSIAKILNRDSKSATAFYTFIFDQGGFVIVSGDDCARPILAFSDDDDFATTEEAPAVKWWLDSYVLQIETAKQHNSGNRFYSDEWKEILNPYYADQRSKSGGFYLVKSRWNQRPLYNNSCPLDSGRLSVTGCVATTTAQIMKYWNYPDRGTGTHTYSCTSTYPAQTLYANYDSIINWSIMPHKLTAASAPQVIKAVANLNYKAGIGLNMSYSAHGSGTQASAVPEILKSHYKYSQNMLLKDRYDYPDDNNWLSMLKTELDAGRPVAYSGMELFSGHSWICDGYNEDNLLHMNWGWGGSYNGYFALNAVKVANYSFNYSHTAVVGIRPAVNNGLNCRIVQPAENSYFDRGQNINVIADAVSQSSSIAKVEFYFDDVLKSTDCSKPFVYSCSTTNAASGGHTIRALAYDASGAQKDFSTGFYLKNPANQIIAAENFEKEILPSGWQVVIKNSTVNWRIANWSVNDFVHVNPASHRSAICSSDNYTSDELLISPLINLNGYANPKLDFAVLFSRLKLVECNLTLKVSEDNGANWTEIWNALTDTDSQTEWKWRQISLNLSNYINKTVKFAWNYKGSKGDGVAIDDFMLFNEAAADLPVITLENPTDGQTVLKGDPLPVVILATDNGAINQIMLYLDNSIVSTSTTPTLNYQLATVNLTNGPHLLKVTVKDNSNKVSTKKISLNIADSSPQIVLLTPGEKSLIKKGSLLTFQASVNSAFSGSAVQSVKFFVDGILAGIGIAGEENYNCSFNTASLTLGIHTVKAQVINENGQSSTCEASMQIYQSVLSEEFDNGIPSSWQNVVNIDGEPGQIWKSGNPPSTLNPSGLTDSKFAFVDSYTYDGYSGKKQHTRLTTKGYVLPAEIDTMLITLDECYSAGFYLDRTAAQITFSTDSLNWTTLRYDSTTSVVGTTYKTIKKQIFSIPQNLLVNRNKMYLSFRYRGTKSYFWTIDNIHAIGWKSGSATSVVSNTLIPECASLQQNYPNPFNPVTRVNYQLSIAGNSRVTVYNAKGELVKVLSEGIKNAGKYSVIFDGSALNSGIYFYKLEVNGKSMVKRMLLVK